MKIVCDSCATKYSISDDKVRGKVFKIRCKKCSHIIVVRGTADASAPPPSAAAPEGGGWHLVVDGEQVGPLTEADIRGRISRGEINAETYIWKEGFADWLKLAAVPEFADSVATEGSAEPSAPTGGADPFADSRPVSDSVAARASTADDAFDQPASSAGRNGGLFAAVDAAAPSGAVARAPSGAVDVSDAFAAPPAAARGGGGDLFAAAHMAAPQAAEDNRRSASGGHHDGGRVENLTGQRHENSVLFSLANLQSLAMPSAAAKSSSNGGGAVTTSSSSDGSGLIDIRAMAATTMGSPADARNGGGGGGSFADDLPAFGSFSSAAPVLFPVAQSSGPPKWLYPLVALMILLLAGIGVMAFKILTTKPVTVMAPAPVPPAPIVAPAPAAPAVAPKTAAAGAPGAPAAPPSTIPDENLPPREGETKTAEAKHEHEKGEKGGKKGHGGGKDKDKKGGGAVADSGGGKSGGSAAVAAAPPEEKKPVKGSLDDLLAGALSNKKPRSRQSDDAAPSSGRRGGGDSSESASAGPLAKSAVVSGMNSVKPKVNDCYNQFKVPGLAMVTVVIGKSGKVSSATVTGKFAGTPTGGCVEKAVKSATFPPSDGLSTPYPFSLK
jgi:predicted Zn finger-like uncharacterized protein